MKHVILVLLAIFMVQYTGSTQVWDKVQRKVKQRKDRKENEAIDKGLDGVEGIFKKKEKEEKGSNDRVGNGY